MRACRVRNVFTLSRTDHIGCRCLETNHIYKLNLFILIYTTFIGSIFHRVLPWCSTTIVPIVLSLVVWYIQTHLSDTIFTSLISYHFNSSRPNDAYMHQSNTGADNGVLPVRRSALCICQSNIGSDNGVLPVRRSLSIMYMSVQHWVRQWRVACQTLTQHYVCASPTLGQTMACCLSDAHSALCMCQSNIGSDNGVLPVWRSALCMCQSNIWSDNGVLPVWRSALSKYQPNIGSDNGLLPVRRSALYMCQSNIWWGECLLPVRRPALNMPQPS